MKSRYIKSAVVFLLLSGFQSFGYEAPFITTAEKADHINDTTAVVESVGEKVLIFYPGIERVMSDGKALSIVRINRDLVSVELPAGRNRIEVAASGEPICGFQDPVSSESISTPNALLEAVASAPPGQEVIVRNGVYMDWNISLVGAGTSESPVIIRPETPGGVVFCGRTSLTLSGSYLEFREFIFDQNSEDAVIMGAGVSNRVTQCQFFFCGSVEDTFLAVLRIDPGCDFPRVDHCYFTGSKNMSLKVIVPVEEPGTVSKNGRLDHNVFRDIHRIWRNGQENIQVGQHKPWTGIPETLVDFNLFDNASADNETCSFKSQKNIIRHNVFANCRESGLVFRGGPGNRFEGNIVVGCGEAIRVFDENHVVVNNLIIDCLNYGVAFIAGHEGGVPPRNCLVANNTIVGGPVGIGVYKIPVSPEFYPSENIIKNNLITSDFGELIQGAYFRNFVVDNNLLYATDAAAVGLHGTNAIFADPKLSGSVPFVFPAPTSPAVDAAKPLNEVAVDRQGRARPFGSAPDIGADEAGGLEVNPLREELPHVPEIRNRSLSQLVGSDVLAWNAQNPLSGWKSTGLVQEDGAEIRMKNASMILEPDLPANFVVEFNYHPESFTSEVSMVIAEMDSGNSGYRLVWGGVASDGKPEGLIRLYKTGSDQPVASHPDLCLVRQNYIYSWPGLVRIERDIPHEDLWYRIQIVRKNARIEIYMNRAVPNRGANPSGTTQPVIIWDDSRGVLGNAPDGTGFRIQQRGAGRWTNFRIWHHESGEKNQKQDFPDMNHQLPVSIEAESGLFDPVCIDIDFNGHSEGDVIFNKMPRYNYSKRDRYFSESAGSSDLVFFMGSQTRGLIQARGAGHEKAIFLNGAANFSQPKLGVYFVKVDLTAGGENKTRPVRINWSFDILGASDDPNFDPENWEVLINYKNRDPLRDIAKISGSVVAQTFSFNNAGRNGKKGWVTISGDYDIPAGKAVEFGVLQIRGTKGGYVASGKGLLCLDNIKVTVVPVSDD